MTVLIGLVLAFVAVCAAIIIALVLYTWSNARRAEALVPRTGRFIDVDGARLHYVEMGSGPPIVMIHGLSCDLNTFRYAMAERLSEQYRIIMVDRPGCGYSVAKGRSSTTLRVQAAVIGRFIEAVGAKGALLVGHSLGGAVSLALAVDEPDLVGGLALIAPLTQHMAKVSRIFAPLTIPSPILRRIVSWTVAAPMGVRNRDKSMRVIFGPDRPVDDFDTRGGGALSLRPSAVFTASSEVTLGTAELIALTERYATVQLPVGILYGRGDRVLDTVLHGERTASMIPETDLETISGGHMIPLTDPDIAADFVRRQARRMIQQVR